MQIPSQEFETPIVIGEPAVSIRVTEQHHQPICLGIFSEDDRRSAIVSEDVQSATRTGSPRTEFMDGLAT